MKLLMICADPFIIIRLLSFTCVVITCRSRLNEFTIINSIMQDYFSLPVCVANNEFNFVL